jgi:hypothetical protein
MKRRVTWAVVSWLAAIALRIDAQWLNQPTANIPRSPDGKPVLSAPAPRGADGHPDFSGPWSGRPAVFVVPADALNAQSRALVREREENYFKDRPTFRCQPSGPETPVGWRRFIQSPSVIAIVYDNLNYRLIFMDGRRLEANPERTWMGYSVGRWEGDTLVVDSFGFNDRTWLDARGMPHTEALRTTERYRRGTVGRMQVELTVTDPGVFTKPWSLTYELEFQPDTEMVEAVCEEQSRWIGRLSEVERTAVTVPEKTLAKYVGVYSGLWGTRPRTVRIELEHGVLYATGLVGDRVRLIPQSENTFMGSDGLSFDFDPDREQAAYMVERHVSGDWKYTRQPVK